MPAVLEQPLTRVACAHCGETCPPEPLLLADKPFCCAGCRTVYEPARRQQPLHLLPPRRSARPESEGN
ncbi:hypothetical protein ACFQT0_05675 [Hymenobacter humi]|uniref:Ferredoxin n=1 Tax=Hymenobacter humi TaxID=1411620 RepID=A0ABW2U255_9BACT